VRLARQWAGDAAVAAIVAEPRPADGTTLVDSTASLLPGARLDHLLTAQIDFVQAVTGGVVRLESVTANEHGHVASGRLARGDDEDPPLLLTGTLTTAGAPRASVRELLFAGRRSVDAGDGRVARASVAVVGDDEGDRTLPAVNETAYRVGLRALARDIQSASTAPGDLVAYLAALDVVAAFEKRGS
jgi:hypothetical protein